MSPKKKEITETAVQEVVTCPFLGLKNDAGSLVAYETTANYCHRCQHPTVPSFEQQRSFCMSQDYQRCLVFVAEPPVSMPIELRYSWDVAGKKGGKFRISKRVIAAGLAFIILLVIVIFGTSLPAGQAAPEFLVGVFTPTLPPPETVRVTPTLPAPTPTEMPTLVPSASPEPTATSAPVLFQLDTPLGVSQKYVIHRLLDGENLQLLATRYKTTPDAILAVTAGLTSPVWAGKLVIVPLEQTELSGLPVLEPYEVQQDSISLPDLALILDLDGAVLEELNGCTGCTLLKGSWLLIPRKK